MSYTPRHLRRGYTDNSGSGDRRPTWRNTAKNMLHTATRRIRAVSARKEKL